jgi:hypothetical protein
VLKTNKSGHGGTEAQREFDLKPLRSLSNFFALSLFVVICRVAHSSDWFRSLDVFQNVRIRLNSFDFSLPCISKEGSQLRRVSSVLVTRRGCRVPSVKQTAVVSTPNLLWFSIQL